MSGVNKRVNERVSGPVLMSGFLVVSDHSVDCATLAAFLLFLLFCPSGLSTSAPKDLKRAGEPDQSRTTHEGLLSLEGK